MCDLFDFFGNLFQLGGPNINTEDDISSLRYLDFEFFNSSFQDDITRGTVKSLFEFS